jgi:hypothetical protein
MSKFWMIGVTAVVVSVASVALQVRPVRSSDDLLGKAQAQFAVKARDALIQRRMTSAPPSPVDAAPAGAELPYVVASLGPVAVPTTARFETPVAAVAQEAPLPTPSSFDVLVAAPKSPAADTVETTKAIEPPPVVLPATPASEQVVDPKAAPLTAPSPAPAAAPAPEATAVTPVATAETAVAPHEAAKAIHKPRRASNEPRMNAVAHRYERETYGYSVPYNLQSLRAHAPEIAAAVARYM